jgi:ABC-type methionine transport system permease subunit
VYKRLALCKFYKVDEENMGRVEIFDRVLNGLSIGLVALILFDWLSVRMGVAIKGVFAFGSLGTLAFTLGSQKLIAQVRRSMLCHVVVIVRQTQRSGWARFLQYRSRSVALSL